MGQAGYLLASLTRWEMRWKWLPGNPLLTKPLSNGLKRMYTLPDGQIQTDAKKGFPKNPVKGTLQPKDVVFS
ncbi:hypothetical protein NQZ68_009369 [Dissostichus eleginoides]|nr:hypothetical protein NQZ68_009369 [Dissostichus eleginoides]